VSWKHQLSRWKQVLTVNPATAETCRGHTVCASASLSVEQW
jgi:hypothetical protein